MTRYQILTQPIPRGGFGRPLTSTELARLRRCGFSCSRGWIVLRAYDNPSIGNLFRPFGTGYANADIGVRS